MANKPLKSIKFPGLPDTYTIDSGLSEAAKSALLTCFRHVAWTDEHGQDYYDALESALYADQYPKITAALNLGNHIIYTDDSLETLRNYLTVVYYEDRDSAGEVIINYSLSGTFVDGASAIIISYSGLRTIISVPSYQEIAWINGYDSNNNKMANYRVAPFIYGSDNADYDYNRRVCAIEGNFSISGKITIGKYKADIYNGKTIDIQDKWEPVISITVPSTGRQKIRFTPFALNDAEYLTIGENSYMGGTDEANWYYGGNGASKGFFASEYNTEKFNAVGASLGLNIYSIRG